MSVCVTARPGSATRTDKPEGHGNHRSAGHAATSYSRISPPSTRASERGRRKRATDRPPSERGSDPTNALIARRSEVSVPFRPRPSFRRSVLTTRPARRVVRAKWNLRRLPRRSPGGSMIVRSWLDPGTRRPSRRWHPAMAWRPSRRPGRRILGRWWRDDQMFLRFIVDEVDQSRRVPAGVFVVAYRLRDARTPPRSDHQDLLEVLRWFGENLDTPNRFTRSGRASGSSRGICWFRPSAHEHIRNARELARLIDRHASGST
jgi:hypothetical protein